MTKLGQIKLSLWFLSLLVFLSFALTGCDRDNNHRTLADVIKHFKDSGIKIDSIQPLLPLPVRAQDGVVLTIDGRQVGIYKYNMNKKKQVERLERIDKKGYLYIIGRRYPVKINGCFVMIDFLNHPKEKAIVEAFDTFD